jgi:hypothetical protein
MSFKEIAVRKDCEIKKTKLTKYWQRLDNELWVRELDDGVIQIGEEIPFTKSDREILGLS